MTIRHVFSNLVPDATGTLTVWNGATTATVAATDVVRPSNWNSAHELASTISGNTAGASTASGTNIVLAGGNNITLSANGSTISIVGGAGGAADGVNILAAGTQTANTTGTVLFNDANGITFGMANSSVITASHNALTSQSNQAFSAQGGSSAFQTLNFRNANGLSFSNSNGSVEASYTVPTVPAQLSVGNSNLGNTQGDTGVVTGRLVLVGSNNITLSGSTNGGSMTISISGGAGAAGNTGYVSAGTTNASLGTLSMANANGISFGIDGQTLTASYTVPTVTNSSMTVSDAGTSGTVARLAFTNLNGVTLSLSTGAGGSHTIVGSHNALTSQSNQNVTAGNGGFAFQTLSFSNANGFSFGTSAGSAITGSYTVPTQSNQTLGGYFVGNTTGQSSSSTWDARTLSVDGAGIVSAGWSNGTMRISATQSNQAFSADASSTFQTLSLQNSNGISFSNNAGAIRLTHDLQFTSATSAITSAALHTSAGGRIYVTAQSTGQSSSSSYDLRTLSIVPDGIISAGWSNGSFRISATQSNQAFSAGAASSTFQTLSFQDSNGLSFSNNAGAIRVSYTRNVASNAIQAVGSATGSGANTSRFAADDHVHAGVFSVGVSNVGNTAGDTRVDVGRFVLAGGNNITLSQATAAGALNTISIVGAAGGGVTPVASASNGSFSFTTIAFSNANNVTFGTSAGSIITASVAAPGAAAENNWVNLSGNTSGNTTASGSTINFSGINITLSGTNGSQIAFSAPATSSLSATGLVSISTNGSTISIGVPANTATMWFPFNEGVNVAGAQGQATMQIAPVPTPPTAANGELQIDRVAFPLQLTYAANSTGSITLSMWMGLYTRNASTLSRAHSTSYTTAFTFSGTANSSIMSGIRLHTVPWTTTFEDGRYYVGVASRTTTGGANATLNQMLISQINSNFSGLFGVASNRSNQWPLGFGVYSASTTAVPASIAFSQIDGTASLAARPPSWVMINGTA